MSNTINLGTDKRGQIVSIGIAELLERAGMPPDSRVRAVHFEPGVRQQDDQIRIKFVHPSYEWVDEGESWPEVQLRPE